MKNFLKSIFYKETRKRKTFLPSPGLEYRIVLKKGALKSIMKVKGWHTYEEVAKYLGFTRQYIGMLDGAKVACTHEVITRLAVLLGNIEDGWWVHFQIVPRGVVHENHPTWNQEKHLGRMPYRKHSPQANMRESEYPTEQKTEWPKKQKKS